MKFNLKHHGRYIKDAGGTRLFVEENGDPSRPTLLFTVKQKEITQ